MATTREQIDSRGASLLQLLIDNEVNLSNVMNPAAKDSSVYQGPQPDNPINILYPKHPSKVGAPLGAYSNYFLREFNLDGKNMSDFGSGGNMYQPADGILTQDEHDKGTAENAALRGTLVDKWEGKQHDQPFRPNQRYVSGGNDRSKFMELKGRKSLLTLYWEMRGAFVNNNNKNYFSAQGSDGQNKTFTNRYADDEAGYQEQFFNTTKDVYFPPFTEIGMMVSSQAGFNLGQPLGADPSIINKLINQGRKLAESFFGDLADAASISENEFLNLYYKQITGIIIGAPERVSQLFKPGWERPNLPRLEVQPLTEVLQQNLLLPPNTGLLDAGGANGTEGTMSSTFGELYLQNRAEQSGYGGRFRKGIIAGTGINDLQEPLRSVDGDLIRQGGTPSQPKVDVPFTFEGDDAEYLTHYKKMAGFTTNGRNTQSNPNAMESAVTDFSRSATPRGEYREGSYRSNAREVVGISDGQYFPFTFATVNKKNNRMQLCTLQATIQSLGESYTPTWQSKHFFGRSEQVHTYTFTDRTIDLSFIIFADSMRQLQNVYERVLWLAQQCYPDYSNENRLASGPVIAMRLGDLFQYKAGFIRSLSYDWNFLGPGGKWELTRGMRTPQGVSVTMSYQIIHEKVPDRDYNFYGGPAGGLAAGVKNQKRISWKAAELEADDIDESTGNRYIPTHTLLNGQRGQGPNYGEVPYLDHIEDTNAARFDEGTVPTQDPIDRFTNTRSVIA